MTSEVNESGLKEGRKVEDLQAGRPFVFVLFNEGHQMLLRRSAEDGIWSVSLSGRTDAGETVEEASARAFKSDLKPVFILEIPSGDEGMIPVLFASVAADVAERISGGKAGFFSIEEVRKQMADAPANFAPEVSSMMERIAPHVVRIPYLLKSQHEYNYRFRPEKLRNRAVYQIDRQSERLYQSALCQAIKEVKRVNERSSVAPALLDFGAVSYVLPSHFGFCLGVQNAIERAYESIAENPGRPVYMLSELIHNPFVNADLQSRGLRYLQSDKGQPLIEPASGGFYWDLLRKDDVVVIPAFGATDEDKVRLIEKGIAVNRYDATCMLVEKVWKAAQRFGREGYTVVIHGKAEHEETKATFSNAAKAGAALIVRNHEEAERLGAVIRADAPGEKRRLFEAFAEQHTPGFDPARDLERLAVVNQTTLLRNETLRIIAYLEDVLAEKFGRENLSRHLNSNSKGDTLCYATQVNQDALQKALALDLDFALVAGGKNSSNTYQLFRMCQERMGAQAAYIQSEENIPSASRILHYSFTPAARAGKGGEMEERTFLGRADRPMRILLTGGASCPDGIIQQIIFRINSFFPPEKVRPVADVLAEVQQLEGG